MSPGFKITKMKKLHVISRWLVLLSVALLIPTLIQPLWRIDLFAPQYPEGLYMLIWKDHLSGDIQVINGLNHYIGMKTINEDMFPELDYITYVLYFMMGVGLIAFLINKRWILIANAGIFIVVAVVALYDFYRWGYDYGHNLDPDAAIQVPGMSYQPPVLGHKKLLNFDAWSTPAEGGWFLVASGSLIMLLIVLELWYFSRKNKTRQL
jgi:copper chaperone NosL